MMLQNGIINWKSTLASIATDKNQPELAKHILKYVENLRPEYEILSTEAPVHVHPDYSGVDKKKFNITVMPEATCDGCQ